MATFTHTVTWLVNIDGKTTTVSYSYDILNVTNIQKLEASDELATAARRIDFAVTPAFIAGISGSVENDRNFMTIHDLGSGSEATFGGLHTGQCTTLHLASAGGNANNTGSNATTTLVNNDYIIMKNHNDMLPIRCTLLVLHQASS